MTSFFDSLYSQFLLRDLVAKEVPGFVSILAIAGVARPGFLRQMRGFSQMNDLVVVGALYGVSFAVGLLLQFIGQSIGLFKIDGWPKTGELSAKKRSLQMAFAFQKLPKLPEATIKQRERFAILKEMAGNFGMALLVSASALLFGAFTPIFRPRFGLLCLVIPVIAVSVVLFRQSSYHAGEQLLWESEALGKKP